MSSKIRKKVREVALRAAAKQAMHELGAILIDKAGIPCETFSAASDKRKLVLEIDGWFDHMDLKTACERPERAAQAMKERWDKHRQELTAPLEVLPKEKGL